MDNEYLELIQDFYDSQQSADYYERLVDEQNWPENRYTVAGRCFVLPRLQTWHADPGIRYSYSNNLLITRPWTPLLLDLKDNIEAFTQRRFNSVLVNYYRNGSDYVGWHADNERELGPEPYIVSLTLGATRAFCYKHKTTHEQRQLLLPSGSLLIMKSGFQHHWLHSVPAESAISTGRINLTFRYVVMPTSS